MDRFDWLELDSASQASARQPHTAPHDGPTFYAAARRLRESGHFGAAAKYYERAIGFDDHHYGARVELIDTLLRGNRLDVADAVSHEALDAYRQVRLFYASRALVLAHRGLFEQALQLSQVSLDKERSWYAMCARAEIELKVSLTNRGRAIALLEEAADTQKMPWEVHFIGGCMLYDAGWPALAAGFFSEAAHRNTTAVIGWICLGDCFQSLRLYDQALFYYQKATELEPAHEIALDRQKRCAPALYGLMRVFQRDALRKRWNKEFEKLRTEWRATLDDY